MRFLTALLLSIFTLNSHAAGFCGRVDISQTSSTDLMNIIFSLDGGQVRRQSCGLFSGEELPFCSSCDEVDETAMHYLRPLIGRPSHLQWHERWHKIRGESVISEADFTSAINDGFIAEGTTLEQFKPHLHKGKLHGEDFLFMHRMMLKMVQLELATSGRGCIVPWSDLPASVKDSKWPLPRDLSKPEVEADVIESLNIFRDQLASFRDPARMAKIKTLNSLGARIEPVLHQNLHAFYRDSRKCSPEASAQGYCDDLLPNGTSPLNKHFWMIHGMIDSLVGLWLDTHGYKTISTDCTGVRNCYSWQGTWIGKYPRD